MTDLVALLAFDVVATHGGDDLVATHTNVPMGAPDRHLQVALAKCARPRERMVVGASTSVPSTSSRAAGRTFVAYPAVGAGKRARGAQPASESGVGCLGS
jgi:hypothetical protein